MTEKPIRVILADDHEVLRFGLRALLSKDPGISIVGEVGDGAQLTTILRRTPADLIILDLSMPGVDGLKALATIRKDYAKIKILIFTMHKEREFFRQALAMGVHGYVLKDDNFDRMLAAVKDVWAGRKYYSSDLAAFAVEDYTVLRESALSLELLTRREKEILLMIAQGNTNNGIARKLDISPRTIQTHRTNLMRKLDLRNTADLVRFAVTHGLT